MMGIKKHDKKDPRWQTNVTHKGLMPKLKYKVAKREDDRQIRTSKLNLS